MNRFVKLLLTSALLACTVTASACSGGAELGEAQKTPPSAETTAPVKTDAANATPAESTEPPAVSEVPSGAEKWIDACGDAQRILMTYEQIQEMNASIRANCTALTDIASYPESMSKSELTALIESSSGPSLPKYDEDGIEITAEELAEIRENRNLDALEATNSFRKGVTIQRTDIRALPTARAFYDRASVQDHDRMQESELAAGSAVWILHTSKDGAFCFIQSYYYVGWADADDIADAEGSSDWDAYAKLLNMTENASQDLRFAVITDPLLEVKGTKLDMGTALLLSETQSAQSGTYRILLPGKDADGRLIHTETELSAASASLGYLDYTFRNFYIQAFKYVGTPYGWGGMKDGVDCSSYVLSVFKTFGFVFPRNTGQQNGSVGNITNTEAMSEAEKLSVLAEADSPVLLYKSGHVMIYLGVINDVHYIIHAPGGGSVREAAYDGFSSLIRICGVGPLK